jgi:hypothetical protein
MPFKSTGAISLSSINFNDISFEWALTHRSFQGSYLTLLILPSSEAFHEFSPFSIHWRPSFENISSFSIVTSPSPILPVLHPSVL